MDTDGCPNLRLVWISALGLRTSLPIDSLGTALQVFYTVVIPTLKNLLPLLIFYLCFSFLCSVLRAAWGCQVTWFAFREGPEDFMPGFLKFFEQAGQKLVNPYMTPICPVASPILFSYIWSLFLY